MCVLYVLNFIRLRSGLCSVSSFSCVFLQEKLKFYAKRWNKNYYNRLNMLTFAAD